MGVVFTKQKSESQLSQQMLDAIIASFTTLSTRQCTGASCIQHSPTAAVQNSQLPFFWAMAH